MKAIAIAIAAVALLCSGCGELDEKGRPIYKRQFHYVVFDGHEYVMYLSYPYGGIAHSPRCECRKGGAE